ncbi:MAG: DM13 domain-containing protein [Chloroflexota bacterium]
MRLRVLWMLVGAVLVAATFTFPYWQPIVENRAAAPAEAFPDLAPQLQDDFLNLPQEQQRAYLVFDAEEHAKALAMVTTALSPRTSLPEDDQAMPEMSSPVTIASGTFQQINAVRWAQGNVNIYQDASNALTMRFENFTMLNAPGVRVYLSAADAPTTSAEMNVEGSEQVDIAPLLASDGSQNYTLPDVDLTQYRSVVIYSQSLDLVYSYAPLFVRQ